MRAAWHVPAVLILLASACHRTPGRPATAQPPSLAGEWRLVEVSGQPAPTGAGGRHATLQFETAPARVSGFAGCNRLTAGYTIEEDSLRFTAAALTRMACTEGMELERRLTEALNATVRYQVRGNELLLIGPAGTVARFER